MTEINDSNFELEVLQSTLPSLINFKTSWCIPCQMLSPVVDQVSEAFEGKVNVIKLDVDENPETAGRFGIRNVPVLLFLKDGEVVDKIVGATTKSNISNKLNNLLETI